MTRPCEFCFNECVVVIVINVPEYVSGGVRTATRKLWQDPRQVLVSQINYFNSVVNVNVNVDIDVNNPPPPVVIETPQAPPQLPPDPPPLPPAPVDPGTSDAPGAPPPGVAPPPT